MHASIFKTVRTFRFLLGGVVGLLLVGPPLLAKELHQEVPLPFVVPDDVEWLTTERQYYSQVWQTEVITNVAEPSLEVFRPEPEFANGTAVVIAPGGSLHALSINSEGHDVARWLMAKGITAFVLKYRLVPTGMDGVSEIPNNENQYLASIKSVLPWAIADGLAAVEYVRDNAGELGIKPDRIGFMGFSAGGTVAMGVIYQATPATRPDFIVPVYPSMRALIETAVPVNAPPMFLVCASDDQLGLAPDSIDLYSRWIAAGNSAELHMYAKGQHGFGMRTQNLPSDRWIERFYDWALGEGIVMQADD